MKKKYFLYSIAGMWAFCSLSFLPVFGGWTRDILWFCIPATALLLGGWTWYKVKGLD
jgi:hypothetical protein